MMANRFILHTFIFSLLLEDFLPSELLSLYNSRLYNLAFDIPRRCNTSCTRSMEIYSAPMVLIAMVSCPHTNS